MQKPSCSAIDIKLLMLSHSKLSFALNTWYNCVFIIKSDPKMDKYVFKSVGRYLQLLALPVQI